MASRRTKVEYLRTLLVAFVISTAFIAPAGGTGWQYMLPVTSFIFGTTMFYTNRIRKRIRTPMFWLTIILNAVLVLLGLSTGLLILFLSFKTLYNFAFPWNKQDITLVTFFRSEQFRSVLVSSFLMSIVFVTIELVSRKLGQGVLLNWILGKYYHPRSEERIFLFLDLRDSTAHAETLGDLKFSALLRDFLNGITDPLIETQGEISHYIGDSALISWHPNRGLRDGNCLALLRLFQDQLNQKSEEYRSKYGFVPRFKAAMHIGQVVTTDVGEVKSEIVFHGDAINTTARIESLCTPLGHQILISDALFIRLKNPMLEFKPAGTHSLKGKSEEITLWAASTDSQAEHSAAE